MLSAVSSALMSPASRSRSGEEGIGRHHRFGHDRARILEMLDMPFVRIAPADARQVRPGALRAPLERMVVHRFRRRGCSGRSVRPRRGTAGSSGCGRRSSPRAHRCRGRPVRAACRAACPSLSRSCCRSRTAARSRRCRRSTTARKANRPSSETLRSSFLWRAKSSLVVAVMAVRPYSAGTATSGRSAAASYGALRSGASSR